MAGLKVNFGGVLAKYNLTATVEADGTYSITEELRGLTTGTATAQTRDAKGTPSNVAMDFVESLDSGVGDVNGNFVQNVGPHRRRRCGGHDNNGGRPFALPGRRKRGH